MRDKVAKAILNNNDLYEAIFTPHRIRSNRNISIWYCLEKTPPLYSNMVTLSKTWRPDQIFRRIDAIYRKEKWGEWSVKDSFGVLDLREFGFKKLFDAQWIYLTAGEFRPLKTSKNLLYKIVKSEEILSDWKIAWDFAESPGKENFHSELLRDPKVHFVAGFEGKKIVSGCFINKTADVLGISNFFAPDDCIEYWSDLIGFVFNSVERADIVGYERREFAEKLQAIGFGAIGDLTVWLKS